MLWVGLTGGIATGKSTVSRILQSMGEVVIDADQLAREVVKPGSPGHAEVATVFGLDSVLASGDLNRKHIGQIVFADRSKLALLEAIIHPRVRLLAQEKRNELAQAGKTRGFYDIPLLFEKQMQALFDHIVVVACSPSTQLRRLVLREGFSEDEAKRRIAAQLPINEKIRLANDVIQNDGTAEELEHEVAAFLKRLPKS